jgi:alpha-beta hydrolase superfamily lysophospholipase
MHLSIFPENLLRLLATLIVAYLALMVFIYFIQKRMLYFPDKLGADAAGQFGLQPWPAKDNYLGFITGKEIKNPKGVFLVWHGNGGSAVYRTYYPEALERRGYRVILLEYPGYGGRPGALGEKSFVADALAAVDAVRREYKCPVYFLGESLGCGVAAAVAKARNWAEGVVLITPWATLADLAQEKYWYLPARWFVIDKYDNVANLRAYHGKVAVLLAGSDEIVPVNHGQKLFNSIFSPKRLWVFKGAGHNTWPNDADESWWDEMLDFLTSK